MKMLASGSGKRKFKLYDSESQDLPTRQEYFNNLFDMKEKLDYRIRSWDNVFSISGPDFANSILCDLDYIFTSFVKFYSNSSWPFGFMKNSCDRYMRGLGLMYVTFELTGKLMDIQ